MQTAQTIAHIAIDEAAGRMEQPALVVVPTSLVPNWTAELARFALHLRVVVLHGLDRHERRRDLAGVHVVITTYTGSARDIDDMAGNLFRALRMPLKERRERQKALLARIRRQDARAWLGGFLNALEGLRPADAAA